VSLRSDAAGERARLMNEIAEVLHDLCQPLTALQCRLEIGQINETATVQGSTTVWMDCLQECARLNNAVVTMRDLVQQARAKN
jgi:hypothetical protein